MTVTIQISDRIFKRLQVHAKPFTDTPAAVIDRLLDVYEKADQAKHEAAKRPTPTKMLSVSAMPDLTDTRIVEATFGGVEALTPYWNDLVRKVHEIAFSRLGELNDLKRASTANIAEGDMGRQKGYTYIPTLGISVQGVDSNEAWRVVYRLARKINLPLKILLEWRITDKAEFPGKFATVEWVPTSPPLPPIR